MSRQIGDEGEESSEQEDSKCKGPEVGLRLMCLKNGEEAREA